MKNRTVSRFPYFAVVLSFFFFASPLRAEEVRAWTSRAGKSIQATLIRFDGETAELKREDGRVVRIALDKFGEKDREFLKELGADTKEAEDENPFAGGETIARSNDGFLPLDTRATVVPLATIPDWNHTPDPVAEVAMEKPATPLSFDCGVSSRSITDFDLDWSDLHFHPGDSSRLLLSVFVHPTMTSSLKPYTRLFLGDLKKGTVVFTDMPRHFKLLGISPDGTKLLFLEGSLRDVYASGMQTKVHVFQFTDDLQLTRLTGFEPFCNLPSSQQAASPPEEPPSGVAKKKPTSRTVVVRNGSVTVTTHSGLMAQKDPLGRDASGTSKNADVSWGTWLGTDRILLLSKSGCLISLETETGKVAWSIPDGSFGHAVLSPDKRYCVIRATGAIQEFMDEKSKKSLRRQVANGRFANDYPFLLFDVENGRLCGRFEGDSHADGLCFSPDGKTVAASWRGRILRWNMADGKRLEPIYYSYPFREHISVGIPSRRVLNNQELSSPRFWTNNRYLLAGSVLIDTLTESPVWRYTSPCRGKGYHGGLCWFATESFLSDNNAMKLFACRLPHAQVPKQDQTGPDRQPFVMEPGMEIALHVDGSITADRDKITEELEKNIAQNGWGLKPDAPIVMTARIATDPPRDVFYESGRLVFETTYHQMNRGLPKNNPSVVPKNNQQEPPKASYVSPRLELDIKKADKVLWKIFALPDLPNVSQNAVQQTSLQAAVNDEIRKFDYSKWFGVVVIPARIRENSKLNVSTITTDTYRDY